MYIKYNTNTVPVTAAIHWSPHPLLQHFWLLAHSLSSAHDTNFIQVHSSAPYLVPGHTPGFTVVQTHDREDRSLNAECLFIT